jgi:glycosyltransferase involved in cell wall biosynthesis
MMEAWAAGTPVLAHGHCAVTREHCARSNGGLYFTNYPEFEVCLDLALARPALRMRLATNGKDYVHRNYRWDTIVARYRNLFVKE